MAIERVMSGPFKGYPKSVIRKFKKYHDENRHVYRKFRELAFEMHQTGRERYSAETIINVMRWHHDLSTTGKPFKISNDFKPLYARLLVNKHPEFEGFFQFKKVTSRGIGSEEEREANGGIVYE